MSSIRDVPLRFIHPYGYNWTIKVRVTRIWNARQFMSKYGEGTALRILLLDGEGEQIPAILFNSEVERFQSILQEGKVYRISAFSVKYTEKKFRIVPNDMEIQFRIDTTVEELLHDAPEISQWSYNFVSLNVEKLTQYELSGSYDRDVIGLILHGNPAILVNHNMWKRDLVIIDNNFVPMILTFWDNLATNGWADILEMVENNAIIIATSVKVYRSEGIGLMSSTATKVVKNPSIPEAGQLMTWMTENATTLNKLRGHYSGSGGTMFMTAKRVFIDELHEITIANQCKAEGHYTLSMIYTVDDSPFWQTGHYTIKACGVKIFLEQRLWYPSCKVCKKKAEVREGSYRCNGCNTVNTAMELRYVVVVLVRDATGEAKIVLWDKEAERFLGHTCQELEELQKEHGNLEVERRIGMRLWTPWIFLIKLTQTNCQNFIKREYMVSGIRDVDWDESADLMKKTLDTWIS